MLPVLRPFPFVLHVMVQLPSREMQKWRRQAKEYRREVLRMEHKVSAQRRLVPGGSGSGNKGSAEDTADETQLEKLRQRQVVTPTCYEGFILK